jgi:hypothetical protein
METPFIQELERPILARGALVRMADAGVTIVDCVHDLHVRGSNLVMEVLRAGGDFTEWNHYPPDDVRDPKSHAQYYFHAHPQDEREDPDYGHFHAFMRQPDSDAVCHLIAISMSPAGTPERLFTTNRWVTGETWYPADDAIAMLDRFVVNLDHLREVNRWLTAMLILFRPDVEQLLLERDRVVERWLAEHPDTDVFEDRNLEITSALEIDLSQTMERLDRDLERTLLAPGEPQSAGE